MTISLPSGSSAGIVLMVCEKPSVARDVAAALGGGKAESGYIPFPLGYITWGVGHMLEQVPPHEYSSEWKEWRWDSLPMIPPEGMFKTSVKESCIAQVEIIKGLYDKSQILVNACDAGREGELIFWEVMRYCGWGGKGIPPVLGLKPLFRFWSQSNTRQGILDSWGAMKPGSEWLGLAASAYSRVEADWLFGMNFSRAATLGFPPPVVDGKRGFWSIGRVQTPVLALVSNRDRQISQFTTSSYYEVRLNFEAGGELFPAVLLVPEGNSVFDTEAKEPKGFLLEVEAQKALTRVKDLVGMSWAVDDEVKEGKENPPSLFSLTDLQKWCNKNWGWEAKRTLDAAQQAYEEAKSLSYPRTDSSFLPEDSKDKMEEVFESVRSFLPEEVRSGSLLVSPRMSSRAGWIFDNGKISDHYAIVPTGVIPKDLDSDAGKVWTAVLVRFLLAFAAPAVFDSVKRKLKLVYGEENLAIATGKVYTQKGWLDLETALNGLIGGVAKGAPEMLPACLGGQAEAIDVKLHHGKTTPPKYFTEATLLGSMENVNSSASLENAELDLSLAKKGIGTPATRASIIELLIGRGYIERFKKGSVNYLRATEAGNGLISCLRSANLEFLTEPLLTAEWEQKLTVMEKDTDLRSKFMAELIEGLNSAIQVFKKNSSHVGASPGKCPESGGEVTDRGSYWEFPGFPSGRFYKKIASRSMTFEEMCAILKGEDVVYSGFLSKKGQEFSAGLKLDRESLKLGFHFSEKVGGASVEVKTKSGDQVFDCGGYWEFPGVTGKFWKKIAKRVMTLEEYSLLIKEKKTGVFDGFISTANKPFSAALVLGPDGKVTFSFSQRAPTPSSPKMTGPGAKKAKSK